RHFDENRGELHHSSPGPEMAPEKGCPALRAKFSNYAKASAPLLCRLQPASSVCRISLQLHDLLGFGALIDPEIKPIHIPQTPGRIEPELSGCILALENPPELPGYADEGSIAHLILDVVRTCITQDEVQSPF